MAKKAISNVRFDPATHHKLKKLAVDENLKMSAMVEKLIAFYRKSGKK